MSFFGSRLVAAAFAGAGRVRFRRETDDAICRRDVQSRWICCSCGFCAETGRFCENKQRSAAKSEAENPPSGKVTGISEQQKSLTGIVDLFVLLIVHLERLFVLHQRAVDRHAATRAARLGPYPFRETIMITSLANMSCFFVFSSTRLSGRAYDDFYLSDRAEARTRIPSVKIPQYL